MKRKKNEKIFMAYADADGNVYDYEGKIPAFRYGYRFAEVKREELIPLPYGSYLFSLPDRYPVTFANGKFIPVTKDYFGKAINGVSAFLASGYLRTFLPAFIKTKSNAVVLPLWAYCGVVCIDGQFYVPALRIDDDPRSDPAIHENHNELKKAIKHVRGDLKDNRLVEQLSICSTEYNCLCARNFFLGRYECPVPTSPACNADCLGCFSYQDGTSGFCQSQLRLDFAPTPEEISQVILRHFKNVPHGVASFGQGCEGEPLLRGKDLARAISIVREKTPDGTINLNTNGSRPEIVQELIDCGLDSIRVSMCSPTEKYYTLYHRPVNFKYSDVLKTVELALSKGIYVSINLFFMPGFTDSESETDSLMSFLKNFPVNMIQTRNMNIDPDYFFERISFKDQDAIGIRNLLALIRKDFKFVKLGYYNPSIR